MSDESKRSEEAGPEVPAAAGARATEPPSAPPAEPAIPARTPPARLVRRPEGKVIAGVCSGLGAYTGIDPVAWRIGFVVLGLVTGIGLIGYLVAWLVMPMARPGEPTPAPVTDPVNVGRWVGIGAIVLGVLILFRGLVDIHGGLFWGLLLIGLGVALWGRDFAPRPVAAGHRPPPPPPGSAIASATARTDPDEAAAAATTSEIPTPPPPPPADPPPTPPAFGAPPVPGVPGGQPPIRREPSILGRIVLGAAALALGIGLVLDELDALSITPRGMIAVLLAIVGLGLVVGGWWGRARWLIIPGTILAFCLMIVAFVPYNPRAGHGEMTWRPTSVERIRSNYEHGAGQAILDLSRVEFGKSARSVDVKVGFGELLVVVPDDVDVVASGQVQGGEMFLFEEVDEGWNVADTVEDNVKGSAGPLRIDAEVTFGELRVRRELPGDEGGVIDDNQGVEVDIGDSSRRRFNFRVND